MIKKVALSLLSLLLLFAFAGCGAAKNHESPSTSQTAPENTRSDKETDSIDNEQDMAASSDAGEPASGQGTDQDKEEGSDMDSKVLVAYFSCTNTTKELAEYAAEILGADLYEIVPEDPYTEEDLAYYTDGRADQEQNDPSVRPAISGEVENMSQYDTIVLGYPIWHGQAPRIISTYFCYINPIFIFYHFLYQRHSLKEPRQWRVKQTACNRRIGLINSARIGM